MRNACLLNCTGAKKIGGRLLNMEYQHVLRVALEEAKKSSVATISLDGWTDAHMRSVMLAMVILSDRRAYVLFTKDVSEESHTAAFIAGACWSSCQALGSMVMLFCHCIHMKQALCAARNAAHACIDYAKQASWVFGIVRHGDCLQNC